ncbi:bifunctional precorrin-2 dehydrogenase/sirohydrochlorin ferrochelatase [Nitrosopumilus sp. K4]|uniref:precorrin-2 dehydrogenase/sirohydrochlorin ferrochelatase family protein n=1 Tax=Nitrosopumilus sp. K4 TaxID=2795383 RepID=UPI001BA79970|nr:NAD(P)-dependent oxidoreductase [Nitrosopumilus sp. K4]QUC63979.1 bifunctional precorrin-2 dehydrogenase/sirohydrochlorin ferrochelatase [Nitrosopumilus sp. K4]
MIVDLNLQNKNVIVIGGGKEALKRINSLLNQNCKITVVSKKTNTAINKLATSKKIKLEKKNIQEVSFLSELKPDMVITATDDNLLNQKIIKAAKRKKIIAYSSDNPDESDFSNPAIIDFENTIKIAIFTGGKSPAMSKKLKAKSEKIFKKIITKKEIGQIKIQEIARKMAKESIPTQAARKEYINNIMSDNKIDQLIKDGHFKKAEKRAITILRDWK